jgi:hypothetical protein
VPKNKVEDTAAELARLEAEQRADNRGKRPRPKLRTTTLEGHPKGRCGEGGRSLDERRKLAPLGSALAPGRSKAARRPRPRRGTVRLTFGTNGPVLHCASFRLLNDDGSVQTVDAHWEPRNPPRHWTAALVAQLVGAKLAVLSYLDRTSNGTEAAPGVPDPRGPRLRTGQRLHIDASGLSVAQGHGGTYYGRGEAHPGCIRARLTEQSWKVPAWVSDELIAWLIRVVSPESGGAGQLSARELVRLLRKPSELRRAIQGRAAKVQAEARERTLRESQGATAEDDESKGGGAWKCLHRLASSLPRKRG